MQLLERDWNWAIRPGGALGSLWKYDVTAKQIYYDCNLKLWFINCHLTNNFPNGNACMYVSLNP
jgi:hypothetical protein